MLNKLLVNNEKAVVGGLSAGVLALLGQIGVNNQLTLKEAIYAGATWVVTHIVVWVTTNTPKVQSTVAAPTAMNGVEQLTQPDVPAS